MCCVLAEIDEVTDCATMFHRSKRVTLLVPGDEYDLKFWQSGKEQMLADMERALARKAWEQTLKKVRFVDNHSVTCLLKSVQAQTNTQVQTNAVEVGFSVRHAGVGGIARRQESRRHDTDQLASQALGDLDALIDRAREAVCIHKQLGMIVMMSVCICR
jgi:hypothetical protein